MPHDLMTAEEAGRLLGAEAWDATRVRRVRLLLRDGWTKGAAALLAAAPDLARTVVALHAEVARLTAEVEERSQREDRLAAERSRLRNEVVAIRGDVEHDWKLLEPIDFGARVTYRCLRCGKTSTAPVHPYFDGGCDGAPHA